MSSLIVGRPDSAALARAARYRPAVTKNGTSSPTRSEPGEKGDPMQANAKQEVGPRESDGADRVRHYVTPATLEARTSTLPTATATR